MRHGNTAQSPTRKSLPVPTTQTLVELLEQQLLHPKSELLPSQNLMPHLPGKGERHFNLHHVVIKNNIKTKTELLRFASKQMEEGRTDVALDVLNNTPRAVKAMQTCWEMVDAVENEKRQSQSRLQILEEVRKKKCVSGCDGEWKRLASQTLERNNCSKNEFRDAVKNALSKGRGKGRNILITGPAYCGKTFMLKPLCDIFDAFVNPASGTFAWVGVEEAEIIFLNDFRWSERILPWQDMLRLLEGDKIHVPTPKTHFAQDIIRKTFIRIVMYLVTKTANSISFFGSCNCWEFLF